jgi:hypothetical protein
MVTHVFFCGIAMTTEPSPQLNPGDEAAPGTPGSGENVCPICHGTGRILDQDDTVPCSNCGGTGVVVEGIGGG